MYMDDHPCHGMFIILVKLRHHHIHCTSHMHEWVYLPIPALWQQHGEARSVHGRPSVSWSGQATHHVARKRKEDVVKAKTACNLWIDIIKTNTVALWTVLLWALRLLRLMEDGSPDHDVLCTCGLKDSPGFCSDHPSTKYPLHLILSIQESVDISSLHCTLLVYTTHLLSTDSNVLWAVAIELVVASLVGVSPNSSFTSLITASTSSVLSCIVTWPYATHTLEYTYAHTLSCSTGSSVFCFDFFFRFFFFLLDCPSLA